jgi:hypothetical protein
MWQYVPTKLQQTSVGGKGFTSQKVAFFIVTVLENLKPRF